MRIDKQAHYQCDECGETIQAKSAGHPYWAGEMTVEYPVKWLRFSAGRDRADFCSWDCLIAWAIKKKG
jgi:hypothetical protein